MLTLKTAQTGIPRTKSLQFLKKNVFGPPYDEDDFSLRTETSTAMVDLYMLFVLKEFHHLYNFHQHVTPSTQDIKKFPNRPDALNMTPRPFSTCFADVFPIIIFETDSKYTALGQSLPNDLRDMLKRTRPLFVQYVLNVKALVEEQNGQESSTINGDGQDYLTASDLSSAKKLVLKEKQMYTTSIAGLYAQSDISSSRIH